MAERPITPNPLDLARAELDRANGRVVVPFAPPDAYVEADESPPPARITLRTAAEIMRDQRETDWLIEDVIERKVCALMVGARGSLKSFVALHWLMQCAVEGKGVVALSAEGDGLGRRMDAWHRTFAPAVALDDIKLVAYERSISLAMDDVRVELSKVIDGLGWAPDVLLIDTLSKYSAGLDENENSEVRDFLANLSSNFTYVFGCSILLVGHTGYGASDRIRGASSFGANTDAEYIVTRPNPQEFVCKVTRERFKDSPPLEPLAYQGEVVDLGREDSRGRRVTSLVMRGTDVPTSKPKASGANQNAMLVALREWAGTNNSDVMAHDEMLAMFKRQNINRKRKAEILNWLTNAGAILPSVGGFKVNRGAL